jgi:hypothetical protein
MAVDDRGIHRSKMSNLRGGEEFVSNLIRVLQ